MTTDRRLTTAQRSGDRVAWLVERMRQGTLTRSAVELAAYCGDEAARSLVGHFELLSRGCSNRLDTWLPGLADGWPDALRWAALFACEAWSCGDPVLCSSVDTEHVARHKALQAARAHLEAPSGATLIECRYHSRVDADPASALCAHMTHQGECGCLLRIIEDCARLAGEATVLAAIRRGLIESVGVAARGVGVPRGARS